jgi:DNA-binding transcriptional ArsR family regulator
VQRRLGLGWGDTAYLLNVLVKTGSLRRERGGWRDYYFDPAITWLERTVLQSLRSPAERAIVLTIAVTPDLQFPEVVSRVGLAKSTVSFHLNRLLGLGVLVGDREDGVRRFRVRDPERILKLIRQYRSTFRDEFVDRFVEAFAPFLDE